MPVTTSKEMYFWQISEEYPDSYSLVKITELDHTTGRKMGIVLRIGDDHQELMNYAQDEGIISEVIVIKGINLHHVLRGFV